MIQGALAALALVVLALVIRLSQRRRRDEIRSIHHYHDRLDVLHVEHHDRGGSVHLVVGEPQTVTRAAPSRPRLDPDAVHIEGTGATPRPKAPRLRHDREWALERTQPKARIDTPTFVVVVVVIAALVAIGLAGYLIQHARSGTPRRTTTTSTTAPTTPTTVLSTISPRSVDGDVATYSVASATYTVTVTAQFGAEWVEVTSPPGGAVRVARTIAQGSAAHVTLHGTSLVELGAPNSATVDVDGVPVIFPAPVTPLLTLRFVSPA